LTERLFHIVTARDWAVAEAVGTYVPPSLAAEGFVHCSYAGQVAGVARRRFAGVPDVVVVEIDARGLDVRDEDSYGEGVAYPHVYGAIPTSVAVAVHPIERFR
jgi:uncharacterized protein (DUF952 family)